MSVCPQSSVTNSAAKRRSRAILTLVYLPGVCARALFTPVISARKANWLVCLASSRLIRGERHRVQRTGERFHVEAMGLRSQETAR